MGVAVEIVLFDRMNRDKWLGHLATKLCSEHASLRVCGEAREGRVVISGEVDKDALDELDRQFECRIAQASDAHRQALVEHRIRVVEIPRAAKKVVSEIETAVKKAVGEVEEVLETGGEVARAAKDFFKKRGRAARKSER